MIRPRPSKSWQKLGAAKWRVENNMNNVIIRKFIAPIVVSETFWFHQNQLIGSYIMKKIYI